MAADASDGSVLALGSAFSGDQKMQRLSALDDREMVGARMIQRPLSDDVTLTLDMQKLDDEDEDIGEQDDVYAESAEAGPERGVMESILDKDERLSVSPSHSQPYRWICYLRCTFPGGRKFLGTGFFFVPDKQTSGCILTVAHNLYSHKYGVATQVQIVPGRYGDTAPYGVFTVGPESFRFCDKFITQASPDYDYGILMIPKEKRPKEPFGFGYTIMKKAALVDRIVQVCGYPADKPRGTLWLAGGQVTHVTRRNFSYINDTAAGQSGGPIWTWARFNWVVIGIHGWGYSDRNSACRIKGDLIRDVQQWVKDMD